MKMLAGDDAEASDSSDVVPADDAAGDAPDEGFSAAADEVFSAIESKDMESFTSALKTCIEMSK